MQDPSGCVESVGRLLDDIGVRWTVIGALAALEYRSSPRLTNDVDFLAEWHDGLVPALETAGYHVRVMAVPDERPHVLFAEQEGVRVDILFPVVEYQRVALDRASDVLTVEDVIIHKLIAWRPRDRDDIVSILEAGHEIDAGYVEHWAREWDVFDHWEIAQRSR